MPHSEIGNKAKTINSWVPSSAETVHLDKERSQRAEAKVGGHSHFLETDCESHGKVQRSAAAASAKPPSAFPSVSEGSAHSGPNIGKEAENALLEALNNAMASGEGHSGKLTKDIEKLGELQNHFEIAGGKVRLRHPEKSLTHEDISKIYNVFVKRHEMNSEIIGEPKKKSQLMNRVKSEKKIVHGRYPSFYKEYLEPLYRKHFEPFIMILPASEADSKRCFRLRSAPLPEAAVPSVEQLRPSPPLTPAVVNKTEAFSVFKAVQDRVVVTEAAKPAVIVEVVSPVGQQRGALLEQNSDKKPVLVPEQANESLSLVQAYAGEAEPAPLSFPPAVAVQAPVVERQVAAKFEKILTALQEYAISMSSNPSHSAHSKRLQEAFSGNGVLNQYFEISKGKQWRPGRSKVESKKAPQNQVELEELANALADLIYKKQDSGLGNTFFRKIEPLLKSDFSEISAQRNLELKPVVSPKNLAKQSAKPKDNPTVQRISQQEDPVADTGSPLANAIVKALQVYADQKPKPFLDMLKKMRSGTSKPDHRTRLMDDIALGEFLRRDLELSKDNKVQWQRESPSNLSGIIQNLHTLFELEQKTDGSGGLAHGPKSPLLTALKRDPLLKKMLEKAKAREDFLALMQESGKKAKDYSENLRLGAQYLLTINESVDGVQDSEIADFLAQKNIQAWIKMLYQQALGEPLENALEESSDKSKEVRFKRLSKVQERCDAFERDLESKIGFSFNPEQNLNRPLRNFLAAYVNAAISLESEKAKELIIERLFRKKCVLRSEEAGEEFRRKPVESKSAVEKASKRIRNVVQIGKRLIGAKPAELGKPFPSQKIKIKAWSQLFKQLSVMCNQASGNKDRAQQIADEILSERIREDIKYLEDNKINKLSIEGFISLCKEVEEYLPAADSGGPLKEVLVSVAEKLIQAQAKQLQEEAKSMVVAEMSISSSRAFLEKLKTFKTLVDAAHKESKLLETAKFDLDKYNDAVESFSGKVDLKSTRTKGANGDLSQRMQRFSGKLLMTFGAVSAGAAAISFGLGATVITAATIASPLAVLAGGAVFFVVGVRLSRPDPSNSSVDKEAGYQDIFQELEQLRRQSNSTAP